jgi:hypothetical protein
LAINGKSQAESLFVDEIISVMTYHYITDDAPTQGKQRHGIEAPRLNLVQLNKLLEKSHYQSAII